MELNFKRDDILKAQKAKGAIPVANELREDWLTYADEVSAQATLIEQLEKVLKDIKDMAYIENHDDEEKFNAAGDVLSAVSAWREGKEQK